jgi:DNA-binding NarL/FixJ family response regulator
MSDVSSRHLDQMADPNQKQILIVDDEPDIVDALAQLISRSHEYRVVGRLLNAHEALVAAHGDNIDAAFVDLYLPGFHGFALIEQLLRLNPKLKIIVYSAHDDEYFALSALRSGARGFVSKSEPAENTLLALRKVLAGEIYMEDGLRSRLLALVANTPEIEVKDLLTSSEPPRG